MGREERRQKSRVRAKFDVRFRDEADAARAFSAFSVNFSAGGLCIRTKGVYTAGEQLHLDLSIGDEQFALECVVAWVRGDALGVRFVNVPNQLREQLEGVARRYEQPGAIDIEWGDDD
jgi:Tfp pilus assembly protein PilZ